MAKKICPVCSKPVGMWSAYDHPDTAVTHVACLWDYRDKFLRKISDGSSSDDDKSDALGQQSGQRGAEDSPTSLESLCYAPGLTVVFYILAALFIPGGFFLSCELLPGEPPRGQEWTIHAYVPAIATFVGCCVQAAIFAAIGKGLHYLHEIAGNTRKSIS